MENSATVRLIVPPEDDGRPLPDLVAAALANTSEAGAWLIARGGLWVDGIRMRNVKACAAAGMQIAIHLPATGVYHEAVVTADQILYEDNELIALNKPATTYVDSTPWDAEGNLHAALARFMATRDGAAPPLHLAH